MRQYTYVTILLLMLVGLPLSGLRAAEQRLQPTPGARRFTLRHETRADIDRTDLLRRPGERVELALFGDTRVRAQIEEVVDYGGWGRVHRGRLEGRPHSYVGFARHGRRVHGFIIDPHGNRAFEIKNAFDGRISVRQLDPAAGGHKCAALQRVAGAEHHRSAAANLIVPQADGAVIDVLVLYTPAVGTEMGNSDAVTTEALAAIDMANATLSNSGLTVTLRLAGVERVEHTEQNDAIAELEAVTDTDGVLDEAQTLRDQYGADLVCLWVSSLQSGVAGIAWVLNDVTRDDLGYSVVAIDYLSYNTMTHEIGHNFGCGHAPGDTSEEFGLYNDSRGHRFTGDDSQEYRTVMAYQPGIKTPHFSEPSVNYQGTPTGIVDERHNTRAIEGSAGSMELWRIATTGELSFSLSQFEVLETEGVVDVVVQRTGGHGGAATVDIEVIDGTASSVSDADYTMPSPNPQQLSWSDGDSTSRTVTLSITDDSETENDETIQLVLQNVSGATLGTPSDALVIIHDDESATSAGRFVMATQSLTAREDEGSVRVEVQRRDGSFGEASVTVTSTDETANAGVDYVFGTSVLEWADGESGSKYATLGLLDDTEEEATETLLLDLSSATGDALVGEPSSMRVSISDDDAAKVAEEEDDSGFCGAAPQGHHGAGLLPWLMLLAWGVLRRRQPVPARIRRR